MTQPKEKNLIPEQQREGFHDLTLATTTCYHNDQTSQLRSKLALETFRRAAKLNINLIVVDGSTRPGFLKKLEDFDHLTVVSENPSWGMGGGRRAGLKRAIEKHDTSFYLWFEPEKTDLLDPESLKAMIKPLRRGKADIVVPKRRGMESCPPHQAWLEQKANRRATNIMLGRQPTAEIKDKQVVDLWFGPKMFNRKGAEFFLNYRSNLNKWDATIVPVIIAYRNGLKVITVEVDYTYDPRQKEAEENDKGMIKKRLEQYVQILGVIENLD